MNLTASSVKFSVALAVYFLDEVLAGKRDVEVLVSEVDPDFDLLAFTFASVIGASRSVSDNSQSERLVQAAYLLRSKLEAFKDD